MSTFNILSHEEKTAGDAPSSENLRNYTNNTEARKTPAAIVTKQHILSGSRELKHSSSVLATHVAEDVSQQPVACATEPANFMYSPLSKTAMDLSDEQMEQAKKPGRPPQKHVSAVKEGGDGQPNEQIVYSRLPKDYFMQAAEEQMDFDIVVNDIKKLREGFISYVNEHDVLSEDYAGQIDEMLDP